MKNDTLDTFHRRGFCVLRGFLSPHEISSIHDKYLTIGLSDNKNYPIKTLNLDSVPTRVLEKINAVKDELNVGIDSAITNAAFFSIDTKNLKESINSDFHQDHESFYFSGDHTHHLNFWIVIKKNDVNHSNLDLIPFDNLSHADKRLSFIASASGASRIDGNRYLMESEGLEYRFNFEIDSVAETPKLCIGDVLVMRGDVIHRTQDQLTDRIALSIRVGRLDLLVNKTRYYPSSLNHLHFIKNNIKPYAKWAFLFEFAKVDFMTLGELGALYSRIGENYTEEVKSKYEAFHAGYVNYIGLFERQEIMRLEKLRGIGSICT